MAWLFDIPTWTALGTWILVVGTLILMYWQTRENRQLNSANAVLQLRERFDSPRMRLARLTLAQRLLKNQHEEVTNIEVGAFFELVGALTHRKLLDEDLVWEAFGNWITNYYYALRHPVDIVARGREALKDPLIFHEFEWLNDRVLKIDRQKLGAVHTAEIEKEEESRSILQREAQIDPGP
jgi:hypothetical protein